MLFPASLSRRVITLVDTHPTKHNISTMLRVWPAKISLAMELPSSTGMRNGNDTPVGCLSLRQTTEQPQPQD